MCFFSINPVAGKGNLVRSAQLTVHPKGWNWASRCTLVLEREDAVARNVPPITDRARCSVVATTVAYRISPLARRTGIGEW